MSPSEFVEKCVEMTRMAAFDGGLHLAARADCGSVGPELARAWEEYFRGRQVVESSYAYVRATAHIRNASGAMRRVACKELDGATEVLAEFMELEIFKMDTDRALYMGSAEKLELAGRELGRAARSAVTLSTAHRAGVSIEHMLEAYAIYGEQLAGIANLYKTSWNDPAAFEKAFGDQRAPLLSAIQSLAKRDKTAAGDLFPHVSALDAIQAVADSAHGELRITEGSIHLQYFAVLDYDAVASFNERLDAGKRLDGWALDGVDYCEEELDDIWSGLVTQAYLKQYRWRLPPVTVASVGDFCASLSYQTMGVFSVEFSIDTSDLHVAGARYWRSLGMPFAMDEDLSWPPTEQRFDSFSTLAEVIFTMAEGASAKLQRDCAVNWFVSQNIDAVEEIVDGGRRRLDAADLENHPQADGLRRPIAEVRATFNDWLKLPPMSEMANLAVERFHADEFLLVEPHQACLVLVDQPPWVRQQALNLVQIAAAIANKFQISAAGLERELADLRGTTTSSDFTTRAKRDRSLADFQIRIHDLRELVRLGTIMAYPDHARLMRRIFDAMDWHRIDGRLDELVAEVRNVRQALQRRQRLRRTRFLTALGSVLGLLLSVGAMRDLFDLMASAGMPVRPVTQVSFIIGIILVFALIVLGRWRTEV